MNLLQKLHNDDVCLSYFGAFSDDITQKLIGISEAYLEQKEGLGKLKNKVSFLIAECFQNIVKHGEMRKLYPSSHSDFFQLNIKHDRIVLSSCNLIEKNYITHLEKKLTQVNSLNTDELKALYKDILNNKEFSDKGGAGLGLVEMARKSGLPIKYLFKEADELMSQFFLTLEIPTKKGSLEETISILDIEHFYQSLLTQNLLILYKGDFSREIIIPLIDMLQFNFNDNATLSGKEKRGMVTLIETLQNVSKHSKSINGTKEGIFTITKNNDSYTLEVGNYLEDHHYAILKETLPFIKKMNLDEINALYKKRLMEPGISTEGNCGLGLLEIAKHSNTNFSYTFEQNEQNELFFTIKITI